MPTNPAWDIHIRQDIGMKTKPVREVLAENVLRYMREHDDIDTQPKLAKRAKVSQSSISRVCEGKIDTQLRIVESLAAAIGVTPAELLTDQSESTDALRYDRAKLAVLPRSEKEKIESYISFVLNQHTSSTAEADGTISIDGQLQPTDSSRRRVHRASHIPLSRQPVGSDETQKRETKRRGPRKRNS